VHPAMDPNAPMYGAILIRSVACILFTIGLLPSQEKPITNRLVMILTFVVIALVGTVQWWQPHLPNLANVNDLLAAARSRATVLPGLTAWHWSLSMIPLIFGIAAVIGAARHYPGETTGGWLFIAMALNAGAMFHNMFWPTAFSPIFTTTSVIRIAFMTVVLVGAVMELRRIASERQASLHAYREYSRRLTELARLRADFTSMVVHEVSSPLAAIRTLCGVISLEDISQQQVVDVATTIRSEVGLLETLIQDIQMAATLENDDFSVLRSPVSIEVLFADAESFTRTLPGEHSISFGSIEPVQVMADADRIGQVLRNLLSNAAKYSEPGSPIAVRIVRVDNRVLISVEDHGYGIHPDDMTRIFEKFGRGRSMGGQHESGVGLGLYLSRRIVRLHGSDITVTSTPGVGSCFSFELETVH
jgi:signal transduction histidine kinase